MKAKHIAGIIAVCFVLSTCTRKNNYGSPIANPDIILKNLSSFLTYQHRYVRLYEDFKAVDTRSELMTKKQFISQLTSGAYLPLRLKTSPQTAVYQLYKLPNSIDKNIKTTLKYWALDEYEHYSQEGKVLPTFHFVDLAGRTYTKENTKGKILVLKCWFLGCAPCV